MSDDRFDELSRALARTSTRRQAVKVVGATALAGALSLVGARESRAQGRCKKNGSPCRSDYECCSFYCPPGTGKCACPPGAQICPKRPGRPTERCVFCGQNQVLNPDTCECECVEGATACGEYECCTAEQECCSSTYYGYEIFFCCPAGTQCVDGECVAA
jgi:CXCXC repeat